VCVCVCVRARARAQVLVILLMFLKNSILIQVAGIQSEDVYVKCYEKC
jgi:hypothetical protein